MGKELKMTIFLLKIIGLVIVTAIAAFAGLIYVNASRMEEEIEAEISAAEDAKEK